MEMFHRTPARAEADPLFVPVLFFKPISRVNTRLIALIRIEMYSAKKKKKTVSEAAAKGFTE